ncbi:MAG: hypothetical protein R3192_16565 [Woeseiaceae bacterium]|nr:hypothetical protein [Woeseiaceae bacterium]
MNANLIRTLVSLLTAIVLSAPAFAQDAELRGRRLGSIQTWSESVSVGIKELALGSPMTTAETDALIEEATEIADRFGVSLFRETDLLVSDLFRADIAKGKEVILIYRPPTLDKYLAIKNRKANLVKNGEYEGIAREEIARDFGRLLSYPEAVIDQKLRNNGVKPIVKATFEGVWKSPTISLDDKAWRVEDIACRNWCSVLSYEYLRDLLADPANDDVSVVDLHADTTEFNRKYVGMLVRPSTLEKWANYDAAADAALDCTPKGDGLQHQIAAPPAVKFEYLTDRILIRYEYWNAVRTIYMDGRRVPDGVEMSRLGYSTGRHDGTTLIIDTVALEPSQISLMGNKFFLSEDARFVERYELSENGMRMDVAWTVVDNENLRAPYTGKMTWRRAPGWELDVWSCDAITGEY